MRWAAQVFIIFILFHVFSIWNVLGSLGDPYKLLGVGRSATTQEIRKAYKQLAKEWHPDKTDDPSAESKFVEMKQAYELLSDPERRKLYDLHGITNDDSIRKPDNSNFNRFPSDPFDDLFGQFGARFHSQENDIYFFHKWSITARQYDHNILPKSHLTPYLIFFYTDWCFPCLQAASTCRKLVEVLEPLGISFVTVHAGQEPSLSRQLNIHSLPCLVLLLDSSPFTYKESITSIQKIVEFIRHKLPYKLVPLIDDNSIDDFLNGWEDNKVRGLIFEPRQTIRLRYLITAYHFRERVAFGFVDSSEIRKKYQVSADMDTILLFNEYQTGPVASISMKDIPSQTLHHIISSNQFLALPRLSSQAILEDLCPCEWNRPRKRLCVVLITEASQLHDPHRQAFRHFAQESSYNNERVRFAYLYHEKQTEFVNALTTDGTPVEPLLRIVIIWRRDQSHTKYEWLLDEWEPENNLNDTKQKLQSTISRLLHSSEALTYEAFVKDLLDEHAQGILSKIVGKLFTISDVIRENITKDHILPALSIVATVAFILVAGYFMAYLVRMEEENIKKQKAANSNGNNNNESASMNSNKQVYQPELKLHELRAEKYNGLVRLLKPGCRTIVLLVDTQSRLQLIPSFHKIVWPYRKNKTLMFAHMSVERGLTWYKELLELSLPEPRELKINPRNCVGTVLSLNGHRKYFCMYHAKHPETKCGKKRMNRITRKLDDPEAAAFIGFDSETSSDSDDGFILQGDLLDGLSNWLDRLFEGTTHRYYINYWPDFPTK